MARHTFQEADRLGKWHLLASDGLVGWSDGV